MSLPRLIKLKSMQGSLIQVAPLETLKMASLELLRVSTGLIVIVIEGAYGWNWLA